VLAYVGVKMILSHYYPIPTLFSLSVIIATLTIGIVSSILISKREEEEAE